MGPFADSSWDGADGGQIKLNISQQLTSSPRHKSAVVSLVQLVGLEESPASFFQLETVQRSKLSQAQPKAGMVGKSYSYHSYQFLGSRVHRRAFVDPTSAISSIPAASIHFCVAV